ncbi:MAG: SDR family oxidoreductase [Zavarzinella sp.]
MAEGAVPLAIVGIGCIFPRAHGTVRYWSHIKNGVDAVGPVPATHWQPEDYFDGDPKAPDMTYAKRGAFLEPVDFSPQEFGISPNDIEAIDTSQLLGLLAARKALDDAGYNAEREFDRSKVSVILGVTGTLELVIPLGARLGHPKWRKSLQEAGVDESTAQDVIDRIADSYVPWQENSFPGLLGNVVAGRIANRLNLHGTNCVVDAACASSLSAIHMAAMELSLGKADVAVTGGIDTFNDIFMYMCFSKTPALSKTGDAKPFDENGDGTILGEGLGVVVLKRLADAERDGDRVYAVIKGIGTSSDGKGNAVYAPTSEGQMRCLQDAYRTANVSPASIELIEAHGTGTRVGDSVEATALTEVFRNATDRLGFCALGSVKSMIGHTKAAAGVAGLIKVALALYHKVLPPTIKVTRPVSVLNQESPFYLNTQARPWITQGGQPRVAGMSAFGFGGSNFHAVLTEHQTAKQAPDWDGQIQILPFSANSRGELLTQLDQLAAEQDYQRIYLRAKELRTRFRSDLPHRLVVILSIDSNLVQTVAKTKQLLANQSDTTKLWLIKEGIFYSNCSPIGKLGVLFPGQGSQYPAMLRDLACTFPCWIEELSRLEAKWNNPDRMVDAIYPRQNWSREDRDIQVEKLKGTLFAQPSLGVMAWSSWRTLTDFGVQSDQFLGHSYGEVVALCAAGRLSEENLYRVSLARANAMAKATAEIQGAMCAVHSSVEVVEENVAEFVPQVVIANYNSPNQVVVSGTVAGIAQLETKLQRQKIRFSRLPVATAFHSALVAPAAEVFRRNLEEIAITPGSATVYANETAMPYHQDGGEAIELLARQLAKPVRFSACIERMYEAGVRTFLEVGPNSVLSKLTTQILANRPDCQVVALDGSQGKNPPLWDLASCLSQLAALGYSVDLTKWQESYQPEVTTQQGYTVKICGANYTKPRPKRPPVASKEVAQTKPLVVEKVIMNNPSSSHLPHQTAGPAPAVVAESTLQLFQKMQEDTARLHKQFLDHQQAVLATFQALVSGVPPAINVQPIQHSNAPVQVRSEISAPAAISPPPPRPVAEPIASPTPAPKLVPPPEPVKAAPSSSVIGDIQTILLSVVAEKTGYPTEMLDLDMHLDADLGIDSIKRVEILSAFQERVPDAPPVQPDQLGTLQTLRDVMNVLQTAVLPVNQGIDPTSTSSKQAPKAVVSTTNMQQVLLSVVAEKTGYPTEMLELSMHLDADLGIDSIKRVEILSAFQERVPNAPAVQPEQLGALQTLQDVLSVLQANEMAPEQNMNGVHISPTPGVGEDYLQILLDVVADKTGYPVEMLQWEMHLDADLGIDSIKRVEILSAFQERVPTSKAVEPEQLGSLQTLQDVANVLKGQIADSGQPHELNGGPPLPFGKPLADQSIGERENKHADQFGNSPVNLNQLVAGLQVLEPKCQPFDPGLERGRVSLPRGATVVVVCNDESIAQSISQILAEQGFQTICLDWQQLDSLEPNDSIAGLVLVAPSQSVPQINLLGFQWLQRCAGCLKGSAKQSGAFFACITTLGGQFGFKHLSNTDVEHGGLLGIVKTAAHEFSNVNCKAIDVDPTVLQSNIRQIIEELFCFGPIELGITEDGLVHVVETPLVLPASVPPAKLPHGATIIVTGGGRGVTTEAIFPMACTVRPRLILLGRTELDSTEPAWLQELTDDASIKKALIQHSPTRPTPREIEKQCTRILNQRTIRQNIARLAEVCTSVEYIAIDVCNRADIQKVVRQIQHQHGEVAGIVHGAGILHDRKIEDLTTEQFQAVYTTKVDGLQALLGAIDPTKLRLLILFSSSTARYGRTGQIAYAASNEVLNKISQRTAQTLPHCRTVAVNWGPWAGGMVNEGLAKLFASEGIGLISYSQGGAVLLAASSLPDFPAELVVIAEPNDAKDKPQKRTLTLDWQRSPILQSHVLNDVAVVPLAMQLNWLMQQTQQFSAAPVLIENFQVLKPIQVSPAHETLVELEMQPAALQHGAIRSYSATIFCGKQLFSRAQLHVGIAQPAESVSRYKPDRPTPSINEVYSGILFHGKGLQVISEIGSLSQFGAEAIATNPFHETTFAVNDNNRIFAIDAALQLVIIWTAKYLGAPSLPYSIGKFRHLTTSSDVQSWHIRLEITHRSATSVRSNIDILDPEGMLLMQLYQVEHVLNANLQEIFQLSRQRPAPGYSTLVN